MFSNPKRGACVIRHLMGLIAAAALMAISPTGSASAASIKIVPSAATVAYGEDFFFDVMVDGIPSQGLGTAQFHITLWARDTPVKGVSDFSQSSPGEISVVTPLLVGPATAVRSGFGDFFWSGTGPNGMLVMDNEELRDGSALYSFSHTNGATLPAGSGTVARFLRRRME